ncbi:MAG: FAD/NAD(P)-binding protein [Nitrospirae bacterium]|nr:FAD/NAD(P)-binding protein [Nitrospirota bacterium]
MNPLRPLRALIKDIRPEAEGVKTYTISIESSFVPAPGQFNMLGFPGVGEAPISLSSILYNGCFDHTIKSVGRVTGFLDNLKNGDGIFVRGPYGRGWPVKEAEGMDILLIAGGVGLAPIRPIIQTILSRKKSFGSVSLIYGARDEKNILYTDEFKEWEDRISLYPTVDEVLDKKMWKYNVGLVTELLDKVKIRAERTIAFVCGPEIMMRFVCRGLLMNRISQSKIYVSLERRMKCGIAQCGHCQHNGLFVCKDGPVFSYKEVKGLPDGML